MSWNLDQALGNSKNLKYSLTSVEHYKIRYITGSKWSGRISAGKKEKCSFDAPWLMIFDLSPLCGYQNRIEILLQEKKRIGTTTFKASFITMIITWAININFLPQNSPFWKIHLDFFYKYCSVIKRNPNGLYDLTESLLCDLSYYNIKEQGASESTLRKVP